MAREVNEPGGEPIAVILNYRVRVPSRLYLYLCPQWAVVSAEMQRCSEYWE